FLEKITFRYEICFKALFLSVYGDCIALNGSRYFLHAVKQFQGMF
ncbi:hypothetical protein EVA_09336, partial [gut metagenome]